MTISTPPRIYSIHQWAMLHFSIMLQSVDMTVCKYWILIWPEINISIGCHGVVRLLREDGECTVAQLTSVQEGGVEQLQLLLQTRKLRLSLTDGSSGLLIKYLRFEKLPNCSLIRLWWLRTFPRLINYWWLRWADSRLELNKTNRKLFAFLCDISTNLLPSL